MTLFKESVGIKGLTHSHLKYTNGLPEIQTIV